MVTYTYYCAQNPAYWAAVVYIPKDCRLSVWQDTPTHELPVEQVFRIVPITKIDWKETMDRSEQLEEEEYHIIRAMWNSIATANKEKLPKGVRRSLEVGLSLTTDLPAQETIKSNKPATSKGM